MRFTLLLCLGIIIWGCDNSSSDYRKPLAEPVRAKPIQRTPPPVKPPAKPPVKKVTKPPKPKLSPKEKLKLKKKELQNLLCKLISEERAIFLELLKYKEVKKGYYDIFDNDIRLAIENANNCIYYPDYFENEDNRDLEDEYYSKCYGDCTGDSGFMVRRVKENIRDLIGLNDIVEYSDVQNNPILKNKFKSFESLMIRQEKLWQLHTNFHTVINDLSTSIEEIDVELTLLTAASEETIKNIDNLLKKYGSDRYGVTRDIKVNIDFEALFYELKGGY